VQQAREAARRTQCRSQLKQIGLALHNYHDTARQFPPGMIHGFRASPRNAFGNGFSWGAMILPQLDQAPLYNRLDFNVSVGQPPNRTVIESLGGIPGIICPSDAGRAPVRSANATTSSPATSYFGSVGPFDNWAQSSNTNFAGGVFTTDPARPCTIATITDGTSNTIAVGEGSFQVANAGVWLGLQDNGSDPTNGPGFGCCQDQYLRMGIYPITNNPNPARKHNSIRFGSQHIGGAHFLLADGAVRFVSENIQHTLSNVPLNPGWETDGGCWWTGGIDGCDDSTGQFGNKERLPILMGIFQRLHHKSDALMVGEF
jgi:hypothetical protein